MKLTNLNATIPMMQSEDYKERFKAELHQVGIRIEKLSNNVFVFIMAGYNRRW